MLNKIIEAILYVLFKVAKPFVFLSAVLLLLWAWVPLMWCVYALNSPQMQYPLWRKLLLYGLAAISWGFAIASIFIISKVKNLPLHEEKDDK